ncbi:hypothetical protein ACM1RC_31540 [Paenibacillus azoreducens]|uniref:hypothetical protein n=1 Tax=Paenibacillus azoreducens TaxID=116718 RepID=UPI0039F4808B
MAKNVQTVVDKVGLLAQAQAEYEALVEEIRDHFQQARQLIEQAGELSGTDPQEAAQVRQLLDQAEYFETLGNRKDGHERLEIHRRINELEHEVSSLKEVLQFNERVLARQRQALEDAKEEAVAMVQRAEERIQETERTLDYQIARLKELEGKADESEAYT